MVNLTGRGMAALHAQVQQEAETSSMERAGKQVQKERTALAQLPEVSQGHALQVRLRVPCRVLEQAYTCCSIRFHSPAVGLPCWPGVQVQHV